MVKKASARQACDSGLSSCERLCLGCYEAFVPSHRHDSKFMAETALSLQHHNSGLFRVRSTNRPSSTAI